MDKESKKYELSYLLRIALPEEALPDEIQKLAGAIESEKGIISHSEMPRKRRLAYLVNKDIQAYFGWIKFTAHPEAVQNIGKKIKLNSSVLRFLLVEDTIPAMAPLRMPRIIPQQPAAEAKREEEPQERLDLEELDKKLEEILGK
jgi:small subunit ribosomal protein S6